MKLRKMQVGAIFILVVLLIVIAIVFMLLSISSSKEKLSMESKAYIHNYGTSILLSFLRSSTGNSYPECSKVNDLIFKLYSSPPEGKCCGVREMTCKEYVHKIMDEKWSRIEVKLKKGYVYYLEVNKPQSNIGVLYSRGDSKIKDLKGVNKYIIKQEAIPSHLSYTNYPYAVLYIVDKRDLNDRE